MLGKIPDDSEGSHYAVEDGHAVAHVKGVARHFPEFSWRKWGRRKHPRLKGVEVGKSPGETAAQHSSHGGKYQHTPKT